MENYSHCGQNLKTQEQLKLLSQIKNQDTHNLDLIKQETITTSEADGTTIENVPKYRTVNLKRGVTMDFNAMEDILDEGDIANPNDLLPRDGTALYVDDVVHLGPGCYFGK